MPCRKCGPGAPARINDCGPERVRHCKPNIQLVRAATAMGLAHAHSSALSVRGFPTLRSRAKHQAEVTTMSNKRTGGSSSRHQAPTIPLWLRRLDRGETRARAESGVWSAEASFRTGLALMAHALNSLREGIRRDRSHATEADIDREMRRLLERFAQLDDLWVKRWRRERAGLHLKLHSDRNQEKARGAVGQRKPPRSANVPTTRSQHHTGKLRG